MTKISATVVADSKSPQGNRLSTLLITFPRFILAELNTHRMLTKNSASSRAIPFKRMVESVKTNPFIPIAWQKDHKGMQGTEYLTNTPIELRNSDTNEFTMAGTVDIANAQYLVARDAAVEWAEMQHELGVTKQLCNRLLEPFMWHTVLISGTEWKNFFDLRCPDYYIAGDKGAFARDPKVLSYRSRKDCISHIGIPDRSEDPMYWLSINRGQAEIHMMALAEAMWDAMNESSPKQLQAGEWHIPFGDKIDLEAYLQNYCEENPSDSYKATELMTDFTLKVSTAMAARTSYTVVGDEKEISYDRLIGIHDRMATQVPFHASPFEHCARVMSNKEYSSYVKGNMELKESVGRVGGTSNIYGVPDAGLGWCRNYRGFIQYRHILENR